MDSLFDVFRHGSPDTLVGNKPVAKIMYYALWLIPWFAVSNLHFTNRSEVYPAATFTDFLILYFPYWLFWACAAKCIYALLAYQANNDWKLIKSLIAHGLLIGITAYGLAAYFTAGEIWLLSKPFQGWTATFLFDPDAQLYQHMNVYIYLIILGSALFVRQIRKEDLRAREASELRLKNAALQNQLSETKLSVLRQQLQPHFLFNTLNTVASLIEKKENESAYKVVGLLGGLLRTTLDLRDRKLISLGEEIKYLKRYLDIENIRFKDRLTIKYEIPKLANQALVPALILQPVVENTIKHAVTQNSHITNLSISANIHEKRITLIVKDDGPHTMAVNENGLGLSNLRERLRVIYGDAATLDAGKAPGNGFIVKITLPFARKEAS